MKMIMSESSVISFLVPCRKVWLTHLTLSKQENARLGRKVNFAPGTIPFGGKNSRKYIHSIPARQTAKHCAKSGGFPLSDVAAVTIEAKTRTPLKFAGVYPKPANRSRPLVGRSSPYCEGMWRRYCCLTIFSDCRYVPSRTLTFLPSVR